MERLISAKRELTVYTVVLLVAAFLFYKALEIRTYPGTYLGPALWPEIILGLTIITCVISLAACGGRLWKLAHRDRSLPFETFRRSGESNNLPASQSEAVPVLVKWAPWIAVALTGAYVYLLPQIGYFLDTVLYVTAFIYFGNFRKLRIAALVGAGASVVFMIVFMRLVYISLPVGTGPFERVSTFVLAALGIR